KRLLACPIVTGIDEDEPVSGPKHGHVGERMQEDEAGRDLFGRAGRLPQFARIDLPIPESFGELDDGAHARGLYRPARPRRPQASGVLSTASAPLPRAWRTWRTPRTLGSWSSSTCTVPGDCAAPG